MGMPNKAAIPNTISMSTRVDIKIFAEIAIYFNQNKVALTTQSMLIRDSLNLLRNILDTNSQLPVKIASVEEAIDVLETLGFKGIAAKKENLLKLARQSHTEDAMQLVTGQAQRAIGTLQERAAAGEVTHSEASDEEARSLAQRYAMGNSENAEVNEALCETPEGMEFGEEE